MNKIAIVLNEHGEIARITSNEPVEVYLIDDNAPNDRVYRFCGQATIVLDRGAVACRPGLVTIAPGSVEAVIGDSPIGHADDELGAGG